MTGHGYTMKSTMNGGWEVRANPGEEVCDFCNSTPIYAAYDCKDCELMTPQESITGMGHISIEPWAACEACSKLIDAGRWDALLNRACRTFKEQNRFMHPEIRRLISVCHTKFRQNRRAAN